MRKQIPARNEAKPRARERFFLELSPGGVARISSIKYTSRATECREFFNVGSKHYVRGEFEMAILYYSKALKLDSKRASLYFNRGQSYEALGLYSLAIRDYTKAIGLKPKDGESYFWRGDCRFKLREYGKALADYTAAAKLGFRNGELHRYCEQADMFLRVAAQEKA
jgi:tetratricopeptide (TPR) repeat protein